MLHREGETAEPFKERYVFRHRRGNGRVFISGEPSNKCRITRLIVITSSDFDPTTCDRPYRDKLLCGMAHCPKAQS